MSTTSSSPSPGHGLEQDAACSFPRVAIIRCNTCRDGRGGTHLSYGGVTDHTVNFDSVKKAKAAADDYKRQTSSRCRRLRRPREEEPIKKKMLNVQVGVKNLTISPCTELKGRTVKVIKGINKGLAGLVLWQNETDVIVELQTKYKTVTLPKKQVKLINPNTGNFLKPDKGRGGKSEGEAGTGKRP